MYHVIKQQPEISRIGLPTERLNYVAAFQQKNQWCWAASIQMVLNYYGVDIHQEQIVEKSYGVDKFGNLPNWPGSFDLITKNLNNWLIDNGGRRFKVTANRFDGPPKPIYLINEISNLNPIIIAYRTGPNTGHAVVLTGAHYYRAQKGGYFITRLIIRNPWPDSKTIQSLGRTEHSALDLALLIKAHWYIRVRVV